MFVVMNKKAWDRLGPDLQKVFTEVSREWVDKHGKAWDQADRDGRAFIAGLNKEVITLSDQELQRWKGKVSPVLNDYVTACAGKNLPGDKFLADLQDLIRKTSAEAGQ
jgi:TRAP-type C4-dicarboxylate transport system substrate-binding protein